MAKRKSAPAKSGAKTGGKKSRSLNAGDAEGAEGSPFNDQDVKRRLGNFGGAGEHPRQGGRTSGIVGQTKQRTRTDKKASS